MNLTVKCTLTFCCSKRHNHECSVLCRGRRKSTADAKLWHCHGCLSLARSLAVELADCSNDLETSDGYGSLSPSPEYIQRQVSKICAGGYDFACFQIHSGNLLASSLILENLASEPAKPQIVIGGPSANIVYLPYSRRGLANYYFFGDSAETLFDFLVGGNSRPENMLRQEFN